MQLRDFVGRSLRRLPPVRDVVAERDALKRELKRVQRGWPPGHFYSPIPDLDDLREREDEIFSVPATLPDIDLRPDAQLSLISRLAQHHARIPFGPEPKAGLRYGFENDFFSYGDAVVLFALLCELRPARVIEVGSGNSSALMLDTNDQFLNGATHLTFVDPFPARLERLLTDADRARTEIVTEPVQRVDLARFEALEAGDMLFVDSSHVAKVGGDVNWLVFEVLPRLAPGVYVHFHDVFYPFEYPREWVYKGWAWNEAYILRAYLMDNLDFRVTLFNSYLQQLHFDEVAAQLPLWALEHPPAPSGSLWLQRDASRG